MGQQWTKPRNLEISTFDQDGLTAATAAYFQALPQLHQELILALSGNRQTSPVAVIGQAIADGLERMMDEVQAMENDPALSPPISAPAGWAIHRRPHRVSTRRAG
ncbi:MAG TPA: hypothetical protein VN837_11140 [Chloroflexota bacterium]|nr:hypothetical protein [Chloroflexota bacterium]